MRHSRSANSNIDAIRLRAELNAISAQFANLAQSLSDGSGLDAAFAIRAAKLTVRHSKLSARLDKLRAGH